MGGWQAGIIVVTAGVYLPSAIAKSIAEPHEYKEREKRSCLLDASGTKRLYMVITVMVTRRDIYKQSPTGF